MLFYVRKEMNLLASIVSKAMKPLQCVKVNEFTLFDWMLTIRDLKPTNVLLDENDKPVLMDLGSMNKARIEVKGSREAMSVQVRRETSRPANRCSVCEIHLSHFRSRSQDWAAQRCTISYRAPELFNVESHCIIDEKTDIWVRNQ